MPAIPASALDIALTNDDGWEAMGINTSANIGMAAIAVGTDEPACDAACKRAHYEVVADFVVRFVAHLETKPGFLASEPKLLPDGVGLVISYPTSDTIEGVKVASLSNAVLMGGQRFTGAWQRSRVVPMPDATPEVKDADLEFYADGYVTIVPITPDITAVTPLVIKSVVQGFTP